MLAFSGKAAFGASQGHILSPLIDIGTKGNFQSDARYPIVLCMTAQKTQASCGEAFAGIDVAMQTIGTEKLRPILLMPNVADQANPKDLTNLILATTEYKRLGFTILTGDTRTMRNLDQALGGNVFNVNGEGKFYNHSLDAFVLSPQGELIYRQPAEDLTFNASALNQIIDQCPIKLFGICLG